MGAKKESEQGAMGEENHSATCQWEDQEGLFKQGGLKLKTEDSRRQPCEAILRGQSWSRSQHVQRS